MRLWDLESEAPPRVIAHTGKVNAATVRGHVLATVSDDHVLRILDWHALRELARFTDDASLDQCALADDGATVVAGGQTGQLHVLRANDRLRALLAHPD